MKGKLAALLIAFLLAFALPMAFAADSRIESVEYEGFGIVKLEFTRDCDWFTSAKIALSDEAGAEIPYVFIGGEDEECYLRAETIADGAKLNLAFQLEGTSQNLSFAADTGVEYRVKGDDTTPRNEDDDCDRCRSRGHDEDFCPERIDAASLPDDPAELARIFDIERCDRCGGMGHDDDRCPNR